MPTLRSSHALPSLLLTLALLAGCGGDDPVEPDPSLSDLVGDWEASTMVFTSVASPDLSVDVIELGATFFLNIQPSGGYTSSLAYQGSSATELGHLEVEGDRLIFRVEVAPTGSRVDTATFDLAGNTLRFEGRTLFDFDLNGIGEAAELEGTLHR